MNGNYHFGDEVTQYGDHSIGMIKSQGSVDPQVALREMIRAVQLMRGGLSAPDRQVVDDSMRTIGANGDVEQGTLRRALASIAGVATMVGQVGVPVIDAVRKVTAAFGI